MNWLDIIILCLSTAGLIKGLKDGIIRQLASLAALIIAVCFCRAAAGVINGFLVQFDWYSKYYIGFIGYFAGFILIAAIVVLAGKIVHRIVSATPLSIFNHIIGGVLGLFLMLLFLSLAFNVIEFADKNSVFLSREIKVESRFYCTIRDIIPAILPQSIFNLLYKD